MNQLPLKFIDLFAGIGGFRQAFCALGGECVFSSDWDEHARKTYEANYGEKPAGDIRQIDEKSLPDFELLCAGFPCQPFSIAGVSKKQSLGRKHGFEDETQGTLFFEIIRIIKHSKPKILFLENVKNLKSHDKGNTWRIIHNALIEQGYTVFEKIIDAKYYVPQHRERLFIVCFANEHFPKIDFQFPIYPSKRHVELHDIIQNDNVHSKYTLSDKLWAYLQKHKENSAKKGNGFGFGLVDIKQHEFTRTMSARYYKDGSEILIKQANKNPRRLTPAEARRLFGYPDDFALPNSDCQAYKQFGNSIVVPAVKAVAAQIYDTVQEYKAGGARKLSLF